MMCCCRDVDEQNGQASRQVARSIEEHHPPARVIALASFEDDLISTPEVDQLPHNRSKIISGVEKMVGTYE